MKQPTVKILIFTLLLIGLSPTQTMAAPPSCNQILDRAMTAQSAVRDKGISLEALAAINGRDSKLVSSLVQDLSLWIDTCGKFFYVEEQAPVTNQTLTPSQAPFPYTSTFTLHSNPGAPRTIYLNFKGADISGTAWYSYASGQTSYLPAYSLDADYANFSTTEQDVIQSVWQRVSEDYAAFNVDVTTQLPAYGVLERSSSLDDIYGSTVLITNDTVIYNKCGCGGIAYVGVYNQTGSYHEYYQPALVFTSGTGGGTYPKYIAEAASHEAGHNVGLSHDGTLTQGYYAGLNGWAPVMGVGYSEPLVQFSIGEYPSANNGEDDFTVMGSYGLPLRTDDHGDTSSGATSITPGAWNNGVITTRSDVDYFSFLVTASGSHTIEVNPASVSPNLDVSLKIYAGSSLLNTINPSFAKVDGDIASGLNASTTMSLTAGTTYYFVVDGVGFGSPSSYGYSDYGSRGAYQIRLTAPNISISTTSLASGTVGASYTSSLVAVGGSGGYTWTATGLPAGLTLAASGPSAGQITGTPSQGGTFSVAATTQDSSGATSSKTLSLVITAGVTSTALAASSTSISGGSTVSFTVTVTYVGGTNASGTATIRDGSTAVQTITLVNGVGTGSPITPSAGVTHNYTATFVATTNWAASTSSVVAVAVGKVAPTVSLTSTKTATAPNTSITLTSTVRNGGTVVSGVPVRFYRDTTLIATVNTNKSGIASLITSFSSNGTFSMTATSVETTVLSSVTSDALSILVASTPSTPTAPSVSAGTGSITANWTAPSDGGSSITGYCANLYLSGKTIKLIQSQCGLSSTTYTFTGLSNSSLYFVRVSASNLVGQSALSPNSLTVRPL